MKTQLSGNDLAWAETGGAKRLGLAKSYYDRRQGGTVEIYWVEGSPEECKAAIIRGKATRPDFFKKHCQTFLEDGADNWFIRDRMAENCGLEVEDMPKLCSLFGLK